MVHTRLPAHYQQQRSANLVPALIIYVFACATYKPHSLCIHLVENNVKSRELPQIPCFHAERPFHLRVTASLVISFGYEASLDS